VELIFCAWWAHGQDIGGADIQKQEMREAVELPLTHHELYQQIGIDPPRGVLLYGPPGTGKTMLAKAVAHHTTAAFIRVVGSEFVQKYLGEVRPTPPPGAWACSIRCVRVSMHALLDTAAPTRERVDMRRVSLRVHCAPSSHHEALRPLRSD
jgi:hypothetical protein